MIRRAAKRELTNSEKPGAYFQKTLGVLPTLTPAERAAATKYVARKSADKSIFTELVDCLGLDDVVDDFLGVGWR